MPPAERPLPRHLEDAFAAIARGAPGDAETRLNELRAAHPEHAVTLSARWAELQRTATFDFEAVEREAMQIGPYHVLQTLGEGGMGSVYVAEQREPVRRRVAIKVIKLGMDTKAVLSRFEQERQALAVMNHDAIAKVLDAGTTERGQPWFAMELVEGKPIDRYCEEHRLSVPERIALVQQVASGVQHAHQKGLIHRDLKPGNVLVARRGDRHVAKIIDFGIARATGMQLVDETIYTAEGMLLGTPEYMSPEQARGQAAAIDTRTDVYALGVILYELLTGDLPFPSTQLREQGAAEIQRILTEEEPPRPSSRIEPRTEAAATTATNRRTSIHELGRCLKGDLDWVVLKAMAKEPERRYGTPDALAEDLQRYLDLQPVLAGPPSAAYRLSKYVRRNRTLVAAATLVFVAIVGGGIAAYVGFRRADDAARELAAANEELRAKTREAEESAELARRRADETERVAGFQEQQLTGLDPRAIARDLRAAVLAQVPENAKATVRAAVDELRFRDDVIATLRKNVFEPSLTTIDERFAEQPTIRRRLLLAAATTMRDVAVRASRGAETQGLLRRSIAIYERLIAETAADPDGAFWALTTIRCAHAAEMLGEALPPAEAPVVLRRAIDQLEVVIARAEREAIDTPIAVLVELGNVRNVLGQRLVGQDGIDSLRASEAVYQQALRACDEARDPERWASIQDGLANTLSELGLRSPGEKFHELMRRSIDAHRAAIAAQDRIGDVDNAANSRKNLGETLTDLAERSPPAERSQLLEEAEAVTKKTLESYDRDHNPQAWARVQNVLANLLRNRSRGAAGAEHERLMGECIEAYEAALEVYTRDDLPQDFARVRHSLGNAHLLMAKRVTDEQRPAYLQQAIACHGDAAEVFRESNLVEWGRAQLALSGDWLEYATVVEGDEGAQAQERAVQNLESALRVLTPNTHTQLWLSAQVYLAQVCSSQARDLEGEPRKRALERSAGASRALLEAVTRQSNAQVWAIANYCLATAQLGQASSADADGGLALLLDSAARLRRAREVFTPEAYAANRRVAAIRLEAALAALVDVVPATDRAAIETELRAVRDELGSDEDR